MPPPRTPQDVLASLNSLNANHEITILRLSEPITSTLPRDNDNNPRASDVSTSSLDATTPSSLDADLAHYRELFAKLRFSYVEQVTKEKFIRAIVGDPPLIVTPQENLDLEAQNLEAKATLKTLKNDVALMVSDLESRARELALKYENVRLETAQLEQLPAKVHQLESEIAHLTDSNAAARHANPDLNLPLAKTNDLLRSREAHCHDLDRQLQQLQSQVPRKTKELERLHAEMAPLESKRQHTVNAAAEARRRKDAALGGVEDELEERGRWYRAADTSVRQVLEMDT